MSANALASQISPLITKGRCSCSAMRNQAAKKYCSCRYHHQHQVVSFSAAECLPAHDSCYDASTASFSAVRAPDQSHLLLSALTS